MDKRVDNGTYIKARQILDDVNEDQAPSIPEETPLPSICIGPVFCVLGGSSGPSPPPMRVNAGIGCCSFVDRLPVLSLYGWVAPGPQQRLHRSTAPPGDGRQRPHPPSAGSQQCPVPTARRPLPSSHTPPTPTHRKVGNLGHGHKPPPAVPVTQPRKTDPS